MKKDSKKVEKARVNRGKVRLVAAACAMMLTLGAAGVFIFTGESIETTDNSEVTQQTTVQTTETTTSAQTTTAPETVTKIQQIQWHKAGIAEYEVASARQTTTTTPKVTTAAATSAAKPAATTTTKSAAAAVTTKAATTTTKTTTKATTKAATKATTKAAVTTTAAAKTVQHAASENIKYTAEEFEMMCYVVQAEVGNCTEPYKIAVANVIINRVKSSRFAYAKNIKAVLTAGGQFTSISNYYSKTNKPNQSTINCCKRALAGEDNSNGAVYYYSPKICGSIAWFESMQCCLYLDSGLYSAKFFKPW